MTITEKKITNFYYIFYYIFERFNFSQTIKIILHGNSVNYNYN